MRRMCAGLALLSPVYVWHKTNAVDFWLWVAAVRGWAGGGFGRLLSWGKVEIVR